MKWSSLLMVMCLWHILPYSLLFTTITYFLLFTYFTLSLSLNLFPVGNILLIKLMIGFILHTNWSGLCNHPFFYLAAKKESKN